MSELTQRFNKQVDKIAVSLIRQFDERVSSIPNILKLTLGEPDYNTPEHVKEAGIKAISDNYSHYTGMAGLPELRQAVQTFMEKKYQLNYDWEKEILISVGATEAIAASLLSILEPGDKVLLPAPIYPGYEPLIVLTGAEPIYIDTRETDFILTPNALKEALEEHGDKVKAVIFNSPSNPTGVVYSAEQLQALAQVLKEYPIFAISDEVYSELTYEGKHISIAKFLREQTIVVSGVSKSHAMTGWRIGFILAPQELTKELIKTHQYLVTSAATVSQKAAVTALTDGFNDAQLMKKEYQHRRDFVYQKMTKMGFEVAKPSGAFYIFAKIPEKFNQDSMEFCVDLAQKQQLAVIPGIAFGEAGEGYIRISYAASMEVLIEAMEKIKRYVAD
ncbi:MAG TPA: pyridoxal phosphate-dependent aminotransferase [Candidatus Tetragenococcus pullicola]|nr:pyridoxal phosphate-dependent aminotransferase [Candidatus Tetragenococcus pullicola]